MNFCQNNSIFALTIPEQRAFTKLPQRIEDVGTPVFVHGVHDPKGIEELKANGVDKFYIHEYPSDK